MKNLYKRLNIPERATRQQIEFAIQHCEKELLAEDAKAVLLNTARRRVYDRNLQSLSLLASLRRELGILNAPFWDEREFGDFYDDPLAEDTRSQKALSGFNALLFENAAFRFGVIFASLVLFYMLVYFIR
jgi:hypothetical protein